MTRRNKLLSTRHMEGVMLPHKTTTTTTTTTTLRPSAEHGHFLLFLPNPKLLKYFLVRTRMLPLTRSHSHQSRTQSLLASYCACSTKTKGSGKDRFLGDPDWSSEMQYNTISRYLRTFRTSPFQSPSFSSSMRSKKLVGSGYEIAFPRNTQISISFRLNMLVTHRTSFNRVLNNNLLPRTRC